MMSGMTHQDISYQHRWQDHIVLMQKSYSEVIGLLGHISANTRDFCSQARCNSIPMLSAV